MTQRLGQGPVSEFQPAPHGKLSDDELANFLKRLSSLYRSPTTGNPLLSEALNELASWVSLRSTISKTPSKLSKQKSLVKPKPEITQLASLNIEAVEQFIADEHKTKFELIELAYARFSIPRAQLKRLNRTLRDNPF